MTGPNEPAGGLDLTGAAGNLAKGALAAALPPEIQDLLKPGKTPDRIQHAIAWAARRDQAVVTAHNRRGHHVKTFEDIRNLKLEQMDAVARLFARKFRHRAALTGAITGLPGGLWALVAAGADVQLTAVYAVRMAADVAQSYGYDTAAVEEQAHLAEVLALAAGIDGLRGVGNWLTREGLARMLPEVLPRVLMRLSVEITEEQAAKVVGRLIPGLGAAVAGTIDYTFLRVAGDRAIAYYHNRYLIEHGLAADNSLLSRPARVFTALTAPDVALNQAGMQTGPGVVEGSLVAPQGASLGAHTVVPMITPAAHTLLPAPEYVPPHKMRRSAPERFAISLAIFAVIALVVTIMACAALAILAAGAYHNIFP
ncbi:MAG: EcsC family protein [Ktedonobacterales bacterium]